MLARTIALMLVALVFGTLGFWAQDREPPIRIVEASVEAPVVVGGIMEVRYAVERHRSCAFKVDRILLDAKHMRVVLQDWEFQGAPGRLGRDIVVTPVVIPAMFTPGPGNYRIISRYECNPLHKLWPIVVTSDVTMLVRPAQSL